MFRGSHNNVTVAIPVTRCSILLLLSHFFSYLAVLVDKTVASSVKTETLPQREVLCSCIPSKTISSEYSSVLSPITIFLTLLESPWWYFIPFGLDAGTTEKYCEYYYLQSNFRIGWRYLRVKSLSSG